MRCMIPAGFAKSSRPTVLQSRGIRQLQQSLLQRCCTFSTSTTSTSTTSTSTPSTSGWTAQPTRTLSEFVKEYPHLSSIFQQLKLDFCCGGHVPLQDACRERNLDQAKLIQQLEQSVRNHEETEDEQFLRQAIQRADQMDTLALCKNILDVHHEYLKMELPLLQHLMVKVSRVHGDRHEELVEMRDIFLEEYESLANHITEEERLIFEPLTSTSLESIPTDSLKEIVEQIAELEEDHTSTAEVFARLRELSNNLTPPHDACNSYRALFARLQNLEKDVSLHVHKENFILFPRVTAHLAKRKRTETKA